jgi:hypothetical protein
MILDHRGLAALSHTSHPTPHRYTEFIHSFQWRVQNLMIPCRSQELLPFLSIMYFFLPPFSTDYSSIPSHLVLPSISWSTSQSCCSQVHMWDIVGLLVTTITVNICTIFINVNKSYRTVRCKFVFSCRDIVRWLSLVRRAPFWTAVRD